MKKEETHTDATQYFCPVIKDNCVGAYCASFAAADYSRKSVKIGREGDWEPIPIEERVGTCNNPNVIYEIKKYS